LILISEYADTLLNVFIAIAVDNLAQAQAMTAAELAAARQMRIQVRPAFLPRTLTLGIPSPFPSPLSSLPSHPSPLDVRPHCG